MLYATSIDTLHFTTHLHLTNIAMTAKLVLAVLHINTVKGAYTSLTVVLSGGVVKMCYLDQKEGVH